MKYEMKWSEIRDSLLEALDYLATVFFYLQFKAQGWLLPILKDHIVLGNEPGLVACKENYMCGYLYIFGFGPHLALLWTYFWFCIQELVLADLVDRVYEILRIYSKLSLCKTNAIPILLWLWPTRSKYIILWTISSGPQNKTLKNYNLIFI